MTTHIRPAALITLALCLTPALHGQQLAPAMPLPVILHVPSLADSIEAIAGSPVRVLEARVVEVLDPRAVLVEAATKYRALRGQRDRIVVFLQEGGTRNAPELAIGSTVTIVGTARTLVSLRATNEVPWPVRLTREEIKELEVNGAVVGGTIEASEGTPIAGR
jgi:hypothetical protein